MKKVFSLLNSALKVAIGWGLCIVFFGCDNFLDGSDFKEKLNGDIEYARAKSIEVIILPEDGTGSVLPQGKISAKQGYSFSVEFRENEAYYFKKWVAVSKENPEEEIEGVIFESPDSLNTDVKVTVNSGDIRILPLCAARLSVQGSPTPVFSASGVSRDRQILVQFQQSPAGENFVFSEDEIEPETETKTSLVSDENGNTTEEIWAYIKNGETYFKNIKITDELGISLSGHFMQPKLNGNVLTIAVDRNNPFVLASGEKKNIYVTVSKDVYYVQDEYKITMPKVLLWNYVITDVTDEQASIKLSAGNGGTVKEVKEQYSIGETLPLEFTENSGWQFLKWEYDTDVVIVEDCTKPNTKATVIEKTDNASVIKAVCAERPKVNKFELEGKTVSRNSSIEIEFTQTLPQNEEGRALLNKINITSEGLSLKANFSEPFITGNTVTFVADKSNMINVQSGQSKTVTVLIPSDFYYKLNDGTKVYFGGNGAELSYKIDSTTVEKAQIVFSAESDSGTVSAGGNVTHTYSLGEVVSLSFKAASGWQFNGWKIYYADKNGGYIRDVDESELYVEDAEAVSTKLHVNSFSDDEEISAIVVHADSYLVPVVESVKINGKLDLFTQTSVNSDAKIHFTFNKEIDSESLEFSRLGSLTLTKSGNNGVHYEDYFDVSWANPKELILTPKNTIRNLVPNSTDLLSITITLNANGRSLKDSESHELCLSDAIYNSFSINYTIAGTTETTPPVITDINMYSTDDTSDYYFRKLSDTAFSKWTNASFTGEEGLNYKDGVFNQNHVSSVYIVISGYDSDSGIKEIQVTETYLRNSKNQDVVPLDVTHKYEVSPSSSTPDSAGNIIKKYSILYNFDSANTMEDGLFSIDVSFLDNAGNQSEKKTYYVIKDTTNSSNPIVKTPGDIEHLIPIYNAENNCYEMDYMFNEFKPGTDYFFEKNNENYHFVTQRYITVILKSGNIEYEIYKGDIEDTYDIADVINSAFSGRKRNVDIDEELIIKIKEESGVEGEFSIPLYKRSYIAGKASHSIYLYDQVLPTYKTDKDEVIVYFSYTPNPTKDDLIEYYYGSTYQIEPEVGKISYLFCCLKTAINGSEIYRPLYLNKPYIFYNGVDKPESDPTVRFPTITLPDTSLESGEIQYELNTGRATFSINLNYPDDGYDYSQYTYILYIGDGSLVDYGNGREEGDQCYSDTSKITTWTGRIHNVYLIAYNSDCVEVARSEPQQLNLKVVDNHSPVMYLYGNNHQSYNSINNYHYMYSQILYASAPYDFNEKKDKVYNLTSVDCYFVPTSYGKALSKDYVTSGLVKKASLSLSENYRNDGCFSIPYDGIDFGRYYVYFYLEDNSPLHNWSITPGSYPLVYYVADYVPDIAVDTENDKINISAPTYTDKLERTSDFPQSRASSGTYTRWNIHSNYAIIQVLEDNKWTESVACSSWEGPGEMTNNNTAYYYGYDYDDYIWVYSADCDTYSGKFVRVNVNFTSAKSQWSYQIGGNEFDIVQSQPKFIYPDYWRYKGTETENEIVCNNKNWIEGANGYQIFTDNPMFVHTLHCSRNLNDVLKLEKPKAKTEDFINEWESRAQETGIVSYSGKTATSFTYGGDSYKEIPEGNYYVTIAYFADGTTLMGEVKQKQ
ncbi:MAG: hypothetical protein J6Z17_05685 [Treponema sp.]|nr:hypothetical protein [Treponema sp.]